MIRKILTYYAERLDEYLSRTHRQPEGLATVGLIGEAADETPNKLVISLVNLEKEASGDGSVEKELKIQRLFSKPRDI